MESDAGHVVRHWRRPRPAADPGRPGVTGYPRAPLRRQPSCHRDGRRRLKNRRATPRRSAGRRRSAPLCATQRRSVPFSH
eukprot:2744-Pyramimonas_sp.AAC.1